MKKYSEYKNTAFIGIEENHQINESVFSYIKNLFKSKNDNDLNIQAMDDSQYKFAVIISKSITRLKFKTFSFYSILFNLKDVLKNIQTKLEKVIEQEKEHYSGEILKRDYINGENAIFVIERLSQRIENFIKKEAHYYIIARYPISKASPNYVDNKKIVENFEKNFNVIFEPYKKTTWLFTKKIKDLSPYQMLINDIVKAFIKEPGVDIEKFIVYDPNLQKSIRDSDYSAGEDVTSRSSIKVDLSKLREIEDFELDRQVKPFYTLYFKGTKLETVIKGFKNVNRLLSDEFQSTDMYEKFKKLTEIGFQMHFYDEFSPDRYEDITDSKLAKRTSDKKLVNYMTIVYNKVVGGGYNYGEGSPGESDTSKNEKDVPTGHEPDFVRNLNKYFGIKKRTKLIDEYSKAYGVTFPDSMFKTSHKLATNAFKKYIYSYDNKPSHDLDFDLLVELFHIEYKKYKQNQSEPEKEKSEVED